MDVHQISAESEIDVNYPIRCYQGHKVNWVKENSLLSVSEAVRLVGAFGALSKCGNCRSLGVIAFCSSECFSGYFSGALLTESTTVVLKT